MTQLNSGMEAPEDSLEKITAAAVKEFCSHHPEVLIVVVDPDADRPGENTVSVFSQMLEEDGVLASVLSNILQNLLATYDGKQRGGIADQAPIST